MFAIGCTYTIQVIKSFLIDESIFDVYLPTNLNFDLIKRNSNFFISIPSGQIKEKHYFCIVRAEVVTPSSSSSSLWLSFPSWKFPPSLPENGVWMAFPQSRSIGKSTKTKDGEFSLSEDPPDKSHAVRVQRGFEQRGIAPAHSQCLLVKHA